MSVWSSANSRQDLPTILPGGAIYLGQGVVCDGYLQGAAVRVQTHVHTDHMDDFDTSKMFQDLVMSTETRALLEAEFGGDLPYRSNIHTPPMFSPIQLGPASIELLPSEHMLGAVQVQLRLPDGESVGYSGDFYWPLKHPIQVDTLILDSTYGNPESNRSYSQAQAETELENLVDRCLRRGQRVLLRATSGTLERGLQVLSANCRAPIVMSDRRFREIGIYRAHGYNISDVVPLSTFSAASSDPYVLVIGKGDSELERMPVQPGLDSATIQVSVYSSAMGPVVEWGRNSYTVGLTNHADFDGTLEYVKATKARRVITDNSRGRAHTLAAEIRSRLGIHATAAPL